MKYLATIIVFVVFLAGCTKRHPSDCFKSAGKVVSQHRYFEPFKYLAVFDNIAVNLSQGQETKVEIVTGRNLLTDIETFVRHDTLYFYNNNMCNFVRGYDHPINVNIQIPRINKIINMGVNDVRMVTDFNQDTLITRAEGTGDVYLSGQYNEVRCSIHGYSDTYLSGSCNTLLVYTYGTNYVHANDISVRNRTFVETFSLGDCEFNGTWLQTFECNIWRSGNVKYHGHPGQVTDYSSGSQKGRLIQAD